jgi:tight adherence protein C
MFELLYDKIADPRTLLAVIIGLMTVASIIVIGLPHLDGDSLDERMKTVAVERERIRQREREKMMTKGGNLRQTPKAYMKGVVDRYKLSTWLGTEAAKEQLAMAGYRGPQAEVGFLFFRLVTPVAFISIGVIYSFFILTDMTMMQRLSITLVLAYVGLKGPETHRNGE